MPGYSGKSTMLERLDKSIVPMELRRSLDVQGGAEAVEPLVPKRVFVNDLGLTLPKKRFDAAVKSGRLELLDREERFQLGITEHRGPVEGVALFCAERSPYRAKVTEIKRRDGNVEVRFEV
jgi:hypothetical protein